MTIEARYYRDMIVRAVLGPNAVGAIVADSATLDLIATALMQAEAGKALLCAKRYGIPATPIDVMAGLVPDAHA